MKRENRSDQAGINPSIIRCWLEMAGGIAQCFWQVVNRRAVVPDFYLPAVRPGFIPDLANHRSASALGETSQPLAWHSQQNQ